MGGGGGGVVELAGKFGKFLGKQVTNKQNQQAIDRARRQQYEMINSLDWEPMYASQTVPQYQKTQSPVAGAYLSSLLTGNNPDSILTGPNMARRKADAQMSKDAMYGTNQELMAKQNAIESTNPYTFKTPERKVMGEQNQEAMYKGRAPNISGWGVDQGTYDKLVEGGYVGKGADLRSILPRGDTIKGLPQGAYGAAIRNAVKAGDDYAIKSLLNPQKTNKKFTFVPRRDDANRAKEVRNLVEKYQILDDADPSFSLGKRRRAQGD